MSEATMRPTFLPDCRCQSRRLIIVNDIIRCGECYKRYGKVGFYNYTDEFLKTLIDNADNCDQLYQYNKQILGGMNREIRYCPDRHCDKSGLHNGKDFEFDPKTPVCYHENSGGTYCGTQIEFYGCSRGYEI